MSNLNKRILTSFPLSIIALYSIYNNIVLILSLLIISSILIFEFSNILKNIFKRNKKNSFIFLNLFIFYVCLFTSQIYFFLTGEFDNKQTIFLFILLICIFTDIGGFIFGKTFKGKKLTSISPNKTYAGMIGSFICALIILIIFIKYFNFSFHLIFFYIYNFTSITVRRFVYFISKKTGQYERYRKFFTWSWRFARQNGWYDICNSNRYKNICFFFR